MIFTASSHAVGRNKVMSSIGTMTTVTGDVPAEAPGAILPHEHLIHRISVHLDKPDDSCTYVDLVLSELGACSVDCGQLT